MRAKFVNENYPIGAQNDPRAPWNEEYPEYKIILRDGELVLYDGNDEPTFFDPYKIDMLLANKLNISLEELEETGLSIDIYDVTNKIIGAEIRTEFGNVFVLYSELENL